jgi:hypothetical protein
MNKITKLLTGAFVLCASTASAQTLTVVHGIDGRDLQQNQSLAVDVSSNGTCLLKGVTFRGISQALTVPVGVYNIEVRLSNGSCTGALAATGRFDLGLTENATIVAHLTEQKTPVLTKFVNDISDTTGTNARVIVRHTASAPAVAVRLRQTRKIGLTTPVFENGRQVAAEAPAGTYSASILAASNLRTVSRASLEVAADKVVAVYAVGSLSGGTFGLITQSLN